MYIIIYHGHIINFNVVVVDSYLKINKISLFTVVNQKYFSLFLSQTVST